MSSLQDLSLIRTNVEKIKSDFSLNDNISAFYYFVLDNILKLQANEIDDSITDNNYLKIMGKSSGHDRGIDAVYVDDNTNPSTIHLFNCKYTEKFEKLENYFPSNEIDKILGFLGKLVQQDKDIKNEINSVLFEKVEEIWSLFRNGSPRFEIHLCSNQYKEMEPRENDRFKRGLEKFSFMNLNYHLMDQFISKLTHKDKKIVNARFRSSDKLLFEKTDGDIRALILNLDAKDLIRILIDNDSIRNNVDLEDFTTLKSFNILEDAFEDNVRMYLKQRTKINKNIKETALSDSKSRFFYYNNGITITCKKFTFSKIRFPIIELEDLQVVNGSQTIHALFDAFKDNPENFENIEVLSRIYETKTLSLSTEIAEYTNSQNPVKSRDIRSNDYVQKKLESELKLLGYFYERKKNQYKDKNKKYRIDAENAGQALMAFMKEMPSEAKDKKALIFADKYDDIFNDEINASDVLLAIKVLNEVEKRKIKLRHSLLENPDKYEKDSYVLHSTFYFLYTIKRLSVINNVDIKLEKYKDIIKYYTKAKTVIRKAVQAEIKSLENYKESYSHRVFFKGNRPKQYIDSEIKKIEAKLRDKI